MKIRPLLFGLLLSSAALPVFAAEAPPAPVPGPELDQLAYFSGSWSCAGKAEDSPFGPGHATQAKVAARRELGGFWYSGRYEEKKTAENPHPMGFVFFWGYDAAAKAWTLDGFDVFGGRSHQKSPGWQDGKLVFDGEMSSGGQTLPARDTFAKKSEAVMEHTGEIQLEGKWALLDHETCTRKGK